MVSTFTRMTQHSAADTFPDKPFSSPHLSWRASCPLSVAATGDADYTSPHYSSADYCCCRLQFLLTILPLTFPGGPPCPPSTVAAPTALLLSPFQSLVGPIGPVLGPLLCILMCLLCYAVWRCASLPSIYMTFIFCVMLCYALYKICV